MTDEELDPGFRRDDSVGLSGDDASALSRKTEARSWIPAFAGMTRTMAFARTTKRALRS